MQGATDRCQILSKDFAPGKALDAQAYVWHAMAFDSEDIHAQRQSFILPAVHNYAPLQAQQDQACVAGGFQVWLQRVPPSSPASAEQYSCSLPWEGSRWDNPTALQDCRGAEKPQHRPSPCHSKKKLATKARWQLVITQLCGVEMEKDKFVWGLLDLQPPCSTGIVLRAGKWDARSCEKYGLIQLLKKKKQSTAPARSTASHSPFPANPKAKKVPILSSRPWQRNGASSTPIQSGVIHIIFTQSYLSKYSILFICTEQDYEGRWGITRFAEQCKLQRKPLVVLNFLALTIRLILHAWLHQHVELCNVASCRTVQSMTYHLIDAWN